MCQIRYYLEQDRKQVEQICAGNEEEGSPEQTQMRTALLDVFCRYYMEQEPFNCFTAVNEKGEAVGYILCAENFRSWEEQFKMKYLNPSGNPISRLMGRGTIEALRSCSDEYPAHLHIDLAPEYQRKGIGTKLMNHLIDHLKRKGVPGLALCAAADNGKGQSFYRKYGFQELERNEQEIVYGIKL